MLKSVPALCAGVLLLTACTTGGPDDDRRAAVPDLGGRCDRAFDYAIDFERFDAAAQQIAHATGCLIEVRDMATVGGVRPNPVQGHMTPRQAVATAIAGTDLSVTEHAPDRIRVARRP